MAKRTARARAKAPSVPVLKGLNLLERVAEHDAKLDRLLRLSELAKRRLRFWRTVGVIGMGLAFLFGLALWRVL